VKGWRHRKKARPQVHFIFKVLWTEALLEPYLAYRYTSCLREMLLFFDPITNRSTVQSTVKAKDRRGNEHLLFHGTNRACLLGEIGNNVVLCSLRDCSLCSILRTSFDVKRCGKSNIICCGCCSISLLPKALRMHSSGM